MFPIPFNFPFRKKDGSITTMDDAINSGGGSYNLPTASAQTKGGVKIGSGLTMDGEILNNSNPTPYTLPIASDEMLGGVKVGSGLSIDENGELSANGGSNKYCHVVYLGGQYSTGRGLFFTDSNTPFTLTTLATWLFNNNFKDSQTNKSERYPLMVEITGSTSGVSICSPNGTDIKIYTFDGTGHTDTAYYTIYDTVITF